MTEKIIVPTDFSDNSKPGLRFAIRLAARTKATLVFVYVVQIPRPFNPKDKEVDFEVTRQAKLAKEKARLESFVRKIYQSLKLEPDTYECEIIEGLKADVCLIDYCKKHEDIKYIVISTRGASFFNKVLGTNTGNLITKSPVPVIAVPKDYRYKPLRNVLYTSDLENLDSEFDRVLAFAKPKGLSVEILHFSTPSTKELEDNFSKDNLEEKAGYPLVVRFVKNSMDKPLADNIVEQIKKIQPSLVVIFTNQERKFFEKLFLSSMAEDLSFRIQTPMLVFNKKNV